MNLKTLKYKIKSIFNSSTKINESINSLNLKKLTPIANLENHETYVEALIYGLIESDIYNIGLTGTFGSGKSSIIESLKSKIDIDSLDYKIATVSLASFENKKGKDEDEDEDTVDDVEYRIVQQILYQQKSKGFKYSRFNIIERVSTLKLIYSLIITFLFIVSTIIMFSENYFSKHFIFDDITNLIQLKRFWIPIAFCVSTIIILYHLIEVLIAQYKVKGFKNFNFKEGSVEIKSLQEISTLSIYLDEILFFFKDDDTNVLIIEDLDRFNNPVPIFSKLREINQLINRQEYLRSKSKKVTFIYLVRDDLFLNSTGDNQKTKFFDLIVPVIPFISYSNSGDLFFKNFNNEIDKPDWQLIHEISLYVNDMRVLNNVFNEYIIYQRTINKRLEPNKVIPSNLFAIILLKNIEPELFKDLQSNSRNFFEQALEIKSIIYNKIKDELNKKIETTNDNDLKNSLLNKIDIAKICKLKEVFNNNDYYRYYEGALKEYKTHFNSQINNKALNNDLLFYLFKSGYLDENYLEYITLFHDDGRLSSSDNKFVKDVYSNRESDLKRKIDFPLRVLRWMNSDIFLQKYVLNIDILKSLCENKTEFIEKYQNLIKLLKTDIGSSYKVFKLLLFENEFEYTELVNDFIDGDDRRIEIIFDCCEVKKKFTEVVSRVVSSCGITNLPTYHTLTAETIKENFDEFFKNQPLSKTNIKNYRIFLINYSIKFENITYLNNEINSILFETNGFKINYNNINNLIVNTKRKDFFNDEQGLLTYTYNIFGDETYKYLLDNISLLIPIYVEISKFHKEDQFVIKDIISKELNSNVKNIFSKAQITKFEVLDNIEDESLKKSIAEFGLFEVSWENLLTCIEYDFDINEFINPFFVNKLSEEIPETVEMASLLTDSINNDVLKDDKLMLLSSIKAFKKVLLHTELMNIEVSRDLVKGLVENDVFIYSPDAILWLAEFGKEISSVYIINNILNFINEINQVTDFNAFNIEEILELGILDKNLKIKIFTKYLFSYNSEYKISNDLAEFTIKNFDLIKLNISLNWRYFLQIIISETVKKNNREKLFLMLLQTKYDSIKYLDELLNSYSDETKKLVWVENVYTRSINKSDFIESVLNILKKVNYIKDYDVRYFKFFVEKYKVNYKKRTS